MISSRKLRSNCRSRGKQAISLLAAVLQAAVMMNFVSRGCTGLNTIEIPTLTREYPRVPALAVESERLNDAEIQDTPRRFLKSKNSFQQDLNSMLDDPASFFHEPVKHWSLGQWIIFILLALLALCLLRCFCGLLRCIVDSFCNLCCGGGSRYRRNSGYYYQRPPAYNPAYNVRSSYYGSPNDCTCFDLLAAACCIHCCTNGGNGTASDAFCGLCCFELCCRGGRDVVGGGSVVNPSYGTIVV